MILLDKKRGLRRLPRIENARPYHERLELLASVEKLINKEARRFARFMRGYEDDLRQVAYLAAWNAALLYHSDKGTSFCTYAFTAIRRALLRFVNKYRWSCHDWPLLYDDHAAASPVTAPAWEWDETIPVIQRWARKFLDQRSFGVFWDYCFHDLVLRQLAEKYKISAERCRQLIEIAVNKLRRWMPHASIYQELVYDGNPWRMGLDHSFLVEEGTEAGTDNALRAWEDGE